MTIYKMRNTRALVMLAAVFLSNRAWAATPQSAATTLWSFQGPNAAPVSLTLYGGALYGASNKSWANDQGTIFQLAPPASGGGPWTKTVIGGFAGKGPGPIAELVSDQAGNLYGITNYGGRHNHGVVFQVAPPAAPGGAWSQQVIYELPGDNGGGLTVDSTGAVYGTTFGSTSRVASVFKLTPPSLPGGTWGAASLYHSSGDSLGILPFGALVFGPNGVLYGAGIDAGTSNYGSIYQLTPPSSPGGAWTESTLYTFTGGADGTGPSSLLVGPDGTIYGIGGGPIATKCGVLDYSCGLVFQLTQSGGVWTESTIYSFKGYRAQGPSDGALPVNLVLGEHGSLFGATEYGGACRKSCGTIFELDPPASPGGEWVETIIHNFMPQGDGVNPTNISMDGAGNIYGGTRNGGANGTVFMLSAPSNGDRRVPWKETILYNFAASSDAAYPQSPPVADQNGALYGTTTGGGAGVCVQYNGNFGCGTVYQMTPPSSAGGAWAERILYDFTGPEDGAFPLGGVIFGPDGSLYGATTNGGNKHAGTVFRLTPPSSPDGAWTKTTLYSFRGKLDGARPYSPVIFDPGGSLYGTTHNGGAYNHGIFYRLTPPSVANGSWSETVLYSFADGYGSDGGLVYSNGSFYGTTIGQYHNLGTIFQLSPPSSPGGAWSNVVLYSFNNGGNAGNPDSVLLVDDQGALYGTTAEGGTGHCVYVSGCGIVFRLTPPASPGGTWTQNVLYNFSGNGDGAVPFQLLFNNGALIGTTAGREYGTGGSGVFQLSPPASPGGPWTFNALASLDGATPAGGVLVNGVYFGTIASSAVHRYGSIFEVMF